MVEQSAQDPEFEGSNPAVTGTGSVKSTLQNDNWS